jgi:F0F1-type ATP synthase epsilon subunit
MNPTAPAAPIMHVKVYAPFRTYFDDNANSVSARNLTGDFDVLAHHKNFITLLSPCNIVVRQDGKPDFILPITKGVMHVKADQATVFLDV